MPPSSGFSSLFPLPTLEAMRFMGDLAARDRPSALKRRTRAPSRTQVTIAGADGPNLADLYLPAEPPEAGILLVPGVARLGKDDPRMIAFANTVARHRFAVLVPDLVALKDLNVRPSYVAQVREGFRYLLDRPEWAPGGRAGIGGMSFALGPAILAALDPAIRERVRFLFCIGGYYDLFATITYVTTGHHRGPDGAWEVWPADRYGRWVTAASLADDVQNAPARAVLHEMVDRRILDGAADLTDLEVALVDADARALYDLITNQELARVPALLEGLSPAIKTSLASLNVAGADISKLAARLILVHGIEDDLLPYSESLTLHRAAPAGRSRLYLVHGLGHVTMGRPDPLSAWRLMSSVTAFLAERSL